MSIQILINIGKVKKGKGYLHVLFALKEFSITASTIEEVSQYYQILKHMYIIYMELIVTLLISLCTHSNETLLNVAMGIIGKSDGR